MDSQKSTTASEEFESLSKSNEVLFRKRTALCIKNKNLTRDKNALQKRMNDLMGQETKKPSSLPETMDTDETDSHGQTTNLEDCESLRQANKALVQNNKALRKRNEIVSGEIECIQKKINGLISQETEATNSDSEKNKTFLQNFKFWEDRESLGLDTRSLKTTEEKLGLPNMDDKDIQSTSVLQDTEEANKLHPQEKEAERLQQEIAIWSKQRSEFEEKERRAHLDKEHLQTAMGVINKEAKVNLMAWVTEKEKMLKDIEILTKQKSEVEEKESQALRDKEDLLKEMNKIIKEAKMDLIAWEKEEETLHQEMATLTKQKCEIEFREKEAMQVIDTLQSEMQELQAILQEEKQPTDTNEAGARARTREEALKAQLEEAERVHSFDKLLLKDLKEEVEGLRERLKSLEVGLQSEEVSASSKEPDSDRGPDRLSFRRRFVRFFIPGWRRRYTSTETVDYLEQGEQASGVEQAREEPTIWESLVREHDDLNVARTWLQESGVLNSQIFNTPNP